MIALSPSLASISVQSAFADPSAKAENRFSPSELSSEEEKTVEELKKRDREVRDHENAHKAAAGPHAKGGPTYDFQTGPDGKRYAVGGEVQIDTSKIPNNPEATIQKARIIKRAAMAPKEPSSKDRQVASEAQKLETEARRELAEDFAAKNGDSLLGYSSTGQKSTAPASTISLIA